MITPAQYAAFITTVDTTVGAIYSEIDVAETSKQWSSDVSITGSIWSTAWSGIMPKARPWFGSRIVHEPALQTYQVSPIPYELTYGIDKFTIDDSAVNVQSPFWRLLPDMARQWRRQREYELRDLLEASGVQGTTSRQAGMDGLPYFNTAHPIDIYNPGFNLAGTALFSAGTYCNDFVGGVTIDSTLIGGPLSVTALSTLLAYAKMIPGEDGEVLGVNIDSIMVPATLETTLQYLLGAMFLASPVWGAFSQLTGQVGTADNMLARQGLKPIVNRFLRNTKRWYAFDASHSHKPLLWLVREAPKTVPRMNDADPIVFDSHRYTWGGWDRVAPAWNYSFLGFRSG